MSRDAQPFAVRSVGTSDGKGMSFDVRATGYEDTMYVYVELGLRMAEENEGALSVAYRCRLDIDEVDDLIEALSAARDESLASARESGWDPDDDDEIEIQQGRTAE